MRNIHEGDGKAEVRERPENPFFGKDLLSAEQLNPENLSYLFQFLPVMERIHLGSVPCNLLEGKIMVPLFFEPSSRTRLSHQTAMLQLGGKVNSMEDPNIYSSFAKGANFQDEIHTFALMGDLIVIRHPEVGSAQKAAEASHIPVINAGDGTGEHPSQALLDVATIWKRFGRLDGLTVVFGGDILNGRTIHSLVQVLAQFGNNRFIFVSPKELGLPQDLAKQLQEKEVKIEQLDSFDVKLQEADVWYWTRIQKERFEDPTLYDTLKDRFIITPEILQKFAAQAMILMHPFPRVNEITFDVDSDPRAVYLHEQMRNGIYSRMALIAAILEDDLTPEAIIDSVPPRFQHVFRDFDEDEVKQPVLRATK